MAAGRMAIGCLLVLVAVLSVLPGASSASPAHNTFCEGLALAGNCSFYSMCVEKRVPCGPNGYALGYGGKYCIKFTENADEFSKDVRKELPWLYVCTHAVLSIRLSCLNRVVPSAHVGL